LVTGAAGGIGTAIIERLRAAGVTAIGSDLPGRGAAVDADVTDLASIAAARDTVLAEHGRLDIVVSAAGVGVGGPVDAFDDADWQLAIDTNLWGAINTMRAVYPTFAGQRRGHVVFVGSLAGLLGTPLLVPYATAKAGVVGLATSMRPEAARAGVGVSVVCPGPVDTPMLDVPSHGVNVRRYLTDAAGPAIAPADVGDAVVRAITKDRAVIAPKRAGSVWLAARLAPGLAAAAISRSLRKELARA
jgi:NAD(P)-dependent dehydrogenase (short-subunit alcohol dehydrogenase family)